MRNPSPPSSTFRGLFSRWRYAFLCIHAPPDGPCGPSELSSHCAQELERLHQPIPNGPLHDVFIKYEQSRMGQATVQPFLAITTIKTMYRDVCSLAAEKNVAALIVVPFNRDHGAAFSDYDWIVRSNIPVIQAPCSVGILVYPDALGTRTPVSHHFQCIIQASSEFQHQIGILLWGGPDDREALTYASRMVSRTGVSLTVIRFMVPADRGETSKNRNWTMICG